MFKVCDINNMKTLTNEQTAKIEELYKRYATLEEQTRYLDHAEKKGVKSACTKAYNKLNNYLQTFATEKEAQNIIFNLINA